MEEQSRFLEALGEIQEIAGTQGGHLTKKEIQDYLNDMVLSEEQWEAVYRYLRENHIQIEGVTGTLWSQQAASEAQGGKKTHNRESVSQKQSAQKARSRAEWNRLLYSRELQELSGGGEVPAEAVVCFLRGETQYRDQIIESRLSQVAEIARRYQKYAVPVEELIAEGNLGLLHGMLIAEAERERFLQGEEADIAAFLSMLEQEVVRAVEGLIDRETAMQDQENAVLAKTNLLHEAAKYMTEEIGRVPSVSELSEYTGVSEQEIQQIMGLSEDARRVASPGK